MPSYETTERLLLLRPQFIPKNDSEFHKTLNSVFQGGGKDFASRFNQSRDVLLHAGGDDATRVLTVLQQVSTSTAAQGMFLTLRSETWRTRPL